jgi:hypothetical protein
MTTLTTIDNSSNNDSLLKAINENESVKNAVADDADEPNEEEMEEITGADWDEGGPSQCGYAMGVHETLMSVGGSVHKVVGDPPASVDSSMKQIGNWFQEASYAVRDFVRGDKDMNDDTMEAAEEMKNNLSSMIGSKSGENEVP